MGQRSLVAGMQAPKELAASLIYASGPHYFDYIFGNQDRALAFMAGAYGGRSGFWGHAHHITLVDNGDVMGLGAFYSGEVVWPRLLGSAWAMLTQPLAGRWATLWRSARISQLMPPPRRDTMMIEHIAIRPEARGRGLGRWMLEQQLEWAAQRRLRCAELYVSVENPGAERLYQRLGFEVVAERRSNVVPGVRTMRYML